MEGNCFIRWIVGPLVWLFMAGAQLWIWVLAIFGGVFNEKGKR